MPTEPYDYTQLDQVIIFKGSRDVIEMDKDGKYINLIKKSDPRKYFRYNLSKNHFERVNFYKTKETTVTPVEAKNITTWFYKCTLLSKNVHFGRLAIFAKHNYYFRHYQSPVRFIECLGDKSIQAIEQWEALGIKLDEVEKFFGEYLANRRFYNPYRTEDLRKTIYLANFGNSGNERFSYTSRVTTRPQDLSKSLLNYIKENYTHISSHQLHNLKNNYGSGQWKIEKELKKVAKDPEFIDTFYYTTQFRYRGENPQRWVFGTSGESRGVKRRMIQCVQEFNLDMIALARWLKKQKHVDKNDAGYLFGSGNHYYDYLTCERELQDGALRKMDKYPDNFRSQFHRAQEEYNVKQSEIDEKKFKEECGKHKELEYTGKEYIIKLPEQTSDIHHEAIMLSHCVRTYIPRVINGTSLILFCRPKENPDEPLVTIEVVKGVVTQAYGLNDRRPKNEELDFVKEWAEKKDLKLGCWTGYFGA